MMRFQPVCTSCDAILPVHAIGQPTPDGAGDEVVYIEVVPHRCTSLPPDKPVDEKVLARVKEAYDDGHTRVEDISVSLDMAIDDVVTAMQHARVRGML